MLTPAQLRAARGLLDWTRVDLAKAAGVSPETVKNIEHGTFRPQEQTEHAIIKAFYRNQVEFVDETGVRFREDTLSVFEGDQPYLQVLRLMHSVMVSAPTEVMFMFSHGWQATPEVVQAQQDLRDIGCRFRLIVDENNKLFRYPRHEYRAVSPRYSMGNDLHIIFADRVAIFLDMGARIIVLRNKNIADTQRSIFEFLWDHGKVFE